MSYEEKWKQDVKTQSIFLSTMVRDLKRLESMVKNNGLALFPKEWKGIKKSEELIQEAIESLCK